MPLHSMTGFGACAEATTAASAGLSLHVELRSVNSRYLDIKIHQPFGAAADHQLRRCVEAAVGRGRVDLRVSVERGDPNGDGAGGPGDAALAAAGVDPTLFDAVLDAVARARALATEKGLDLSPINPLELLEFSARMGTRGSSPDASLSAPRGLAALVDRALAELVAMRAREGEALASELAALVGGLEEVSRRLGVVVAGDASRLRELVRLRLAELLQAAPAGAVDETRVAQEVALLAQRGDVREELARIDSHLAQLRAVLDAPAGAGQGKRLEFIAQELLREVSTLGSKVGSHEGSALVIDAKALVERVREQVQNVE